MKVSKQMLQFLTSISMASNQGTIHIIGTDSSGVYSKYSTVARIGGCNLWPELSGRDISIAIDSLRKAGCEEVCLLYTPNVRVIQTWDSDMPYGFDSSMSLREFFHYYATEHFPEETPILMAWPVDPVLVMSAPPKNDPTDIFFTQRKPLEQVVELV